MKTYSVTLDPKLYPGQLVIPKLIDLLDYRDLTALQVMPARPEHDKCPVLIFVHGRVLDAHNINSFDEDRGVLFLRSGPMDYDEFGDLAHCRGTLAFNDSPRRIKELEDQLKDLIAQTNQLKETVRWLAGQEE